MTSVHVTTESKQDHATPPVLVEAIAQQFGTAFLLDLAASAENAKCEAWIDAGEDSLSVDWTARLDSARRGLHRPAGDAFLNPPFRVVDPWMEKCREESAKGCHIVSLTLASLGTSWYRKHVEGNALSLVLRKRVTFLGQKDPFPKELMVTLWGFGLSGLGFWDPPTWAVREDLIEAPQAEAAA